MPSTQRATDGKVISFHYRLTLDNGELVDQSGGEPMSYLHGHGNIVPGLEKQLEGKGPGDKLKAVVAAAEGYGEKIENGQRTIPRAAFPKDAEVAAGMQFMAEDDDGEMIPLWVLDANPTKVVIDINHPLAGETLHFDVEVIGVRDATAEELEHGHVHGPDSHHHH